MRGLEIYSPGGMPDGSMIQDRDPLTVPSTRRNPVLAKDLIRKDSKVSTEKIAIAIGVIIYLLSDSTAGRISNENETNRLLFL